ncbi:MAG: AraC family transcriptional regulator [Calditrichaeota bacterium]|nr:MAG: AraC family transcriptional regulator [Calditrichota bacterium]
MIIEYKTIDLFGEMLFEKVILAPPFKKLNPMPNEACFLYIKAGEYNSISEKEQVKVKAEESLLMKCGNYLSQMYAANSLNRYEAVAVHFYPGILKKIYENKIPKFLKEHSENSNDSRMGKINNDVLIQKYFETILLYFENPSLVNEELLILKLKEIILLLKQTENAPVIKVILSNLFNTATYAFREIIDAHVFSTLSITEFAQLANMSTSTFKRVFKKNYNETPARYIRLKRLDKAANLIKISSESITEIAYQCGFNDSSQFSKLFKETYGFSPSQYKLNHIHK